MEIATPALASAPVKAAEVNCEAWTPFCLSSGNAGGVDFSATLRDERVVGSELNEIQLFVRF
jgi:hypothetical protein